MDFFSNVEIIFNLELNRHTFENKHLISKPKNDMTSIWLSKW